MCREFERKEKAMGDSLDALKAKCASLSTRLDEETSCCGKLQEDLRHAVHKLAVRKQEQKALVDQLAGLQQSSQLQLKDSEHQIMQYQVEVSDLTRQKQHASERMRAVHVSSAERVKSLEQKVQILEVELSACRSSSTV